MVENLWKNYVKMNYYENTSCFNLFYNERNVKIGHNHNVWIAISNKKLYRHIRFKKIYLETYQHKILKFYAKAKAKQLNWHKNWVSSNFFNFISSVFHSQGHFDIVYILLHCTEYCQFNLIGTVNWSVLGGVHKKRMIQYQYLWHIFSTSS